MAGDDRFSWTSALLCLAVVALSVALYSYRSSYQDLRESVERTRPTLVRTQIVDGLIGAKLPKVEVDVVEADAGRRSVPSEGRTRAVWLVRIDECPGCLEQRLRRWNALVAETGIDGLVVLVGVGPTRARSIATEAGIRSEVAVDSTAETFRTYGLDAPSVSFVTGADGTVLLADARFYGTTRRCGWRFFDQVRSLYGKGEAGQIRVTGRPSY